jgi:glycosyltransferase involved in cell wall biosynthesis
MGAVTFSLDVRLVECLKEALPFSIFVETGTFKGDTVASMTPLFDQLITVEISKPLWKKATVRFEGESKVKVHLGNSPEELSKIRLLLGDASTLFWLDAHWCVAENTVGDESQCPLLEEISAIDRLGDTSVVLIDDARLFLAPPPEPHDVTQWPSFAQIVTALRRLSDQHELMVINDVIAFYPKTVEDSINGYARKYGVDWLRASQSLSENTDLRVALEEKEAVIQRQHEVLKKAENDHRLLIKDLEEKEAVIQELKAAYENAQVQLGQRGSVIQQQADELSLSKQLLGASEAKVHAMALQIGERDKTIQILSDSHVFASISGSKHTNLALVKSLEEKESVIQDLAKALDAYRAAFGIFGYLSRPVSHTLAAIAGVRNRFRATVAPRLGNLYQYTPRPMCLPPSYEKAITLLDAPKVSIVTPSFKQAGYIGRTIDGVLSQNYPNLEYFVQDGGSQDGTVEILNRYGNRLTGWESKPDGGQSQAINLGFTRTTGEIMAWLNSDDVLLPGAINAIVDYFNRHPDIDVVYGDRLLIDENDQEIGRWIVPGHDSNVLAWADYVPQETVFWRRRVWDKVGSRVDESFRFAMDWDLLVRFRDAGARFAHIPRFLGAFRIHDQQKTSASINDIGHKEMGRIRERLLGRVPSHKEIRKAVLPFLLRHVAFDMAYRIKTRLAGKQ